MALRGTVTRLDRFLASLLYLFTMYPVLWFPWMVAIISVWGEKSPLLDILIYVSPFWLGRILSPYLIPIIFLGLYIFVVRNRAIQGFVRFHTMQALMLMLMASGLLVWMTDLSSLSRLLGPEPESSIVLQRMLGLLSIAFIGASVYLIFCAIMGKYGSIPVLSKAVKSHVRL